MGLDRGDKSIKETMQGNRQRDWGTTLLKPNRGTATGIGIWEQDRGSGSVKRIVNWSKTQEKEIGLWNAIRETN